MPPRQCAQPGCTKRPLRNSDKCAEHASALDLAASGQKIKVARPTIRKMCLGCKQPLEIEIGSRGTKQFNAHMLEHHPTLAKQLGIKPPKPKEEKEVPTLKLPFDRGLALKPESEIGRNFKLDTAGNLTKTNDSAGFYGDYVVAPGDYVTNYIKRRRDNYTIEKLPDADESIYIENYLNPSRTNFGGYSPGELKRRQEIYDRQAKAGIQDWSIKHATTSLDVISQEMKSLLRRIKSQPRHEKQEAKKKEKQEQQKRVEESKKLRTKDIVVEEKTLTGRTSTRFTNDYTPPKEPKTPRRGSKEKKHGKY